METFDECNELKGLCSKCNCITFDCQCNEITIKKHEEDFEEDIITKGIPFKNCKEINILENCSCDLCLKLRMREKKEDNYTKPSETGSCLWYSDNESDRESCNSEFRVRTQKDTKRSPSDLTGQYINVVEEVVYRYPRRESSQSEKEIYQLRSREKSFLNPGETKWVPSNVEIQRTGITPPTRKLEIQSEISNGWISNYFSNMLLIKHGVISPQFMGILHVKMYNKTNNQIVIPLNAPIGKLVASKYDYTF